MALVEVAASGTISSSPVIPTKRYLRFSISESVLAMLNERSRPKKKQEVRAAIEEGVEPERAPGKNQPVPAGDLAHRGDQQRKDRETPA